MTNKYIFSCFIALIIIGLAELSQAQVIITENQPLSFGEFVVTDLSNSARLRIRNNGSPRVNGGIGVLTDPTRGEYTLSNGPSKTIYTITTPSSITLNGPGPDTFLIDNIRIKPNTLKFNKNGIDSIRISADLNTSGSGIPYNNGSYTGTLDLIISY